MDHARLTRWLHRWYRVERTGGDHWRVLCPDGTWYTFAYSTSDRRSAANLACELRRRGIPVPRKGQPWPKKPPGGTR